MMLVLLKRKAVNGLQRDNQKKPRIIIKNKKDITECPQEANERTEFGHFEVDLIVSSKSLFCILVIIERKSRYCILRLLPNKQAITVALALTKELKRFTLGFIKTITYDNGSENAYHETIDKRLAIQSYFCKPYHSWDECCIENLNKLVRRFYLKGTDFSLTKNKHLYNIQNKLNMIPKKSNCFRSAANVINVALPH